MEPSGAFTERRTHPRVPLRLPARIRWQGPLGLRVEMTETVEGSREGVLVHRNGFCEPLARVWIVFPFVRGRAFRSCRKRLGELLAGASQRGRVLGSLLSFASQKGLGLKSR